MLVVSPPSIIHYSRRWSSRVKNHAENYSISKSFPSKRTMSYLHDLVFFFRACLSSCQKCFSIMQPIIWSKKSPYLNKTVPFYYHCGINRTYIYNTREKLSFDIMSLDRRASLRSIWRGKLARESSIEFKGWTRGVSGDCGWRRKLIWRGLIFPRWYVPRIRVWGRTHCERVHGISALYLVEIKRG